MRGEHTLKLHVDFSRSDRWRWRRVKRQTAAGLKLLGWHSPPRPPVTRCGEASSPGAKMDCPVCLEQYNALINLPNILACSHRVCSVCLKSGSGLVSCPLCREIIQGSSHTVDKQLLNSIGQQQRANKRMQRAQSPSSFPIHSGELEGQSESPHLHTQHWHRPCTARSTTLTTVCVPLLSCPSADAGVCVALWPLHHSQVCCCLMTAQRMLLALHPTPLLLRSWRWVCVSLCRVCV